MKRITIYRNKDCAKCRKIARVHKFFDWLNRVQVSTDTPKTGPLQLGEIVVEDLRTGETAKGVDAVRQICRQIPAYAFLLPLLRIPFIARTADKEASGCADGRCAVPQEKGRRKGRGSRLTMRGWPGLLGDPGGGVTRGPSVMIPDHPLSLRARRG